MVQPLISVDEREGRALAFDVVDDDRPRLLARQSQFGYVETTARAVRAEPEAVSQEEQVRQTAAARRARKQQQWQAWQDACARIIDGVTIIRASKPPMPRRIISSVRAIERTIARMDAELRDRL